ncbi:MAG TPA: LysR family transcriptional regulator, partial [Gemmatirosa sp.]
MALNLNQLRLFAAAVRHDGVGAAARRLGVSQPAVSRAVAELERDLGVELLERSARGVHPTAAGRELFEHAEAVAAAERAAEEAMAAARGLTRGTLHVGASTTIMTYVLPPLIGAFARAHPAIDLRLSSVHTRVLVPLVRNYEIDVALAEAPVADPRVLVSRWITDEMVVVAAPTHALAIRAAARGPVPPAALDEELLILREPESGTRELVLRGLTAGGVVPARTMAVDGTEVIKRLVAEGVGIAVVSRATVVEQLALGQLTVVPVRGLHLTRPFNRLSMARRRPSAAARAFLELL